MTDAPPVPPSPSSAPSTPPGTPAGRPRVWQAALIVLAFGALAGGSCAAFLARTNGPWAEPLSLLFMASLPCAAGAFALLLFRVWRRRTAEAWPGLAQSVLMGLSGVVLAIGGCGGWTLTMRTEAFWPIAFGLGAVFVLGLVVALGAGELFLIGIARLVLRRPGAR